MAAVSGEVRRAKRLPKFLFDHNQPCPCGAERRYENCCGLIIGTDDGTRAFMARAAEALQERNFVEAEKLYRAYLVQYMRWVYEHTLPVLNSSPPLADLVEIDVEALAELADTVAYCMARLDRAKEIVSFLNHVESIVPLSDFKPRASLLRATWLHIAVGDDDGARRELGKIGDIVAYGRRDALALYLDIRRSDLPARQRITVAEQIISKAGQDKHITVQYTAAKAFDLLEVGEEQQARADLRSMLSSISAPAEITGSDQISTVWHLANAWSLYGVITDDKLAFSKAEELLHRVPKEMLTPLGRAKLLLDLGWVLRDEGRFQEAAKAFIDSLEISPSTVTKIHLAHSQALSGEIDKARISLAELEVEQVATDLQLEYMAARGSFAIATKDTGFAIETVARLRKIAMDSPFWMVQRDELIIQLLDFVHQPEAAQAADRQRKIVRLLLSVNDTLELKPHLFGIGVNLNKIIEKLLQRFK